MWNVFPRITRCYLHNVFSCYFAIAVGLSFLETSCDTYSSMLGPRKYSNIRLNISQTLVPLGDIAGIVLGKYLIFGSVGNLSETMSHMHGAERLAYGEKMLQLTLQPYKYILIVLIIILAVLAFTPMPSSKAVSLDENKDTKPSLGETIKYLAKNSRFKKVSWHNSSMLVCKRQCGHLRFV